MSTGSVLIGALWLLIWAAPAFPPDRTAEFLQWFHTAPPDQVLAGLALPAAWLCLGWLLGGAWLVALARLPGRAGASCQAISGRVTPARVRRVVEAALGTALVGGSLAAVLPAQAPSDSASAAAPDAAAVADAWPRVDRPATALTPVRPAVPPARPRPPAATAAAPVPARPGDSLWAISGRALGPSPSAAATARAWPRWYAANRRLIGPDPNVLVPGQRLLPPPVPTRPSELS